MVLPGIKHTLTRTDPWRDPFQRNISQDSVLNTPATRRPILVPCACSLPELGLLLLNRRAEISAALVFRKWLHTSGAEAFIESGVLPDVLHSIVPFGPVFIFLPRTMDQADSMTRG